MTSCEICRRDGPDTEMGALNICLQCFGRPAEADSVRALRAEADVARLREQVKKWEDHEVQKAMCCWHNEERVKELEAEVATMRARWDALGSRIDMALDGHKDNPLMRSVYHVVYQWMLGLAPPHAGAANNMMQEPSS